MKKYKIRFNCTSFSDVVVKAENKAHAIIIARTKVSPCRDMGMEFAEFLPVEKDDELD